MKLNLPRYLHLFLRKQSVEPTKFFEVIEEYLKDFVDNKDAYDLRRALEMYEQGNQHHEGDSKEPIIDNVKIPSKLLILIQSLHPTASKDETDYWEFLINVYCIAILDFYVLRQIYFYKGEPK